MSIPQTDDTTKPLRDRAEELIRYVAHTLRNDGTDVELLLDELYAELGAMRRREGVPYSATLADLAAGYWDAISQWNNGAPTGIKRLDDLLGGGFLSGRLVGLLGAPGSGKTALAIQIAESIASAGHPVLYLTSEDSPHMLLSRTLARLYGNKPGMNYGAILRGMVTRATLDESLSSYCKRASARNLLIVEQHGAFSIDAIAKLARQHFTRDTESSTPPLLVIDYLQRLARAMGSVQELRQAVTLLTERCRDLAHELNCCVFVLSAQGRETYKNGSSKDASTLGTAKESGDIEYTCDALMALMPDRDTSAMPGQAAMTLRLDKNRQGPVSTDKHVPLLFHLSRQMFTEVEL